MRKINQFKNKCISTKEAANVKGGGIFCDIYLGYTAANNQSTSNGAMNRAILLDQIVATQGLSVALQKGGSSFMSKYT